MFKRKPHNVFTAHFNKTTLRTSRPEVFCEKGVLKNSTKFTGKRLCQSLFFHKDAGLRPTTSLKKRLWHRCFPMNFVWNTSGGCF